MKELVFYLTLVLLSSLFYYPTSIFASNYDFFESFDNLDSNIWTIHDPSYDSVTITPEGYLKLKPISSYFYPLVSKDFQDPIDSLEVRMKFSNYHTYGAGFAISDKIPEYTTTRGMTWSDLPITIWPKPGSGFLLGTIFCPDDNSTCTQDQYNKSAFDGEANKFYTIKIVKNNNKYLFFVDGNLVFTSRDTNYMLNKIWIGSPEQTGYTIKPDIYVDYIKVNEVAFTPTIIIPGLGASWDFTALYSGLDGNNWKIPSFIKNYDSLIKSFENAGYILDKDLFVFAYDWRKPIRYNSDLLSSFISSKFGDSEKVNIVGHSMGGLIARDYVQNYSSDKVNKVVTLGSPFKGAVDSYAIWEGTTVWDDFWWGKLAVESMIHLTQDSYPNRVTALRSQAPSIKDLLPVFNYISKDGAIVNWDEMNQTNTFLNTFDLKLSEVQSLVTAIVGNSDQTKSLVKVEDRSVIDSLFGLWEDGKPIEDNPFEFEFGDGTVGLLSANGGFSSGFEFPINHIGLPDNKPVIEKIFDLFELDKSKIEIVDANHDTNVLAVFLRSPGKLRICDEETALCDGDLGFYLQDEKMFFVPGFSGKKLTLDVLEDGLGSYHLHIAKINTNSEWEVVEGELVDNGQIDNYKIFDDNRGFRLSTDNNTNMRLLQKCKKSLNEISVDWDSLDYIEKLVDTSDLDTNRLRSARVLQQLFGKLILEKRASDDYKGVQKIFSCWNLVNDEIASILDNGTEDGFYLHLGIADGFLKKIMRGVNANTNLYSLLAFNKAQELLHRTNLIATGNKKLGSELTRSVDQMLLASYVLR